MISHVHYPPPLQSSTSAELEDLIFVAGHKMRDPMAPTTRYIPPPKSVNSLIELQEEEEEAAQGMKGRRLLPPSMSKTVQIARV